jgi:Holliday junction resolvasome RuvABC ATP-dependent DNA helicase subunit
MKSPDKESEATANPSPDAQEEELSARSLAEFVGQTEAMRRLTALVALARRRGEVLGHVLLVGPEGYGKRTLAHIVARELGVNLRQSTGAAIDRAGDLAATVNDLDEGDVFFIGNINRLRSPMVAVLAPSMRSFILNIVVGKGRGARSMRLATKPFTLIGGVQKASDCPGDLLNSFDVVIQLQRYRETEMLQLADRFATKEALSIEPSAIALVARLADGNPGQLQSLFRRLKLVEKQPVSESDAQEMLSVFGYGGAPSAAAGVAPADWAALSGVEFERLITSLLNSMGFAAEMTKATGDGGIDIEAVLDRPIVGGRYLFQCKRFAADSLVGGPTVREFYGAIVADRKALKGILITTSGFTQQAREFAEALPIELIDGERLASLLAEHMSNNTDE